MIPLDLEDIAERSHQHEPAIGALGVSGELVRAVVARIAVPDAHLLAWTPAEVAPPRIGSA